jgi:hypothetical protein
MLHLPPGSHIEVVCTGCRYITAVRMLPHTITNEVQSVIETDFVKMRQADPKNIQGKDLHMLLVVAR